MYHVVRKKDLPKGMRIKFGRNSLGNWSLICFPKLSIDKNSIAPQTRHTSSQILSSRISKPRMPSKASKEMCRY